MTFQYRNLLVLLAVANLAKKPRVVSHGHRLPVWTHLLRQMDTGTAGSGEKSLGMMTG